MSNSSTVIIWLNRFSQFNSYFSLFLFVFGTIGNILNILVLSHRSLRTNSCAWLFLLSSVFNLISTFTGLTTRIIADWTSDLSETIGWLCKVRIYLLVTSRTIASWLLVLATIDRWLLSSLDVQHRQLSSLKSTQRESILVIFLCLLLYSPIFYCHDANLTNAPLKCYSRTIECRVFVDQLYTCFTTLLPLILMFSFGYSTMCHVRRLKRRFHSPLLPRSNIHSIGRTRPMRLRSIDRHLLLMLLVQISCLALLTIPQALHQIYSTITRNRDKSYTRRAWENSLYRLAILLTYLASGMPFYIYTLTGGSLFRQASISLITRIKDKLICRTR